MIRYSFIFDDGRKLDFDVDEKGETSIEDPYDQVPEWVGLEHHRCQRCTLAPDSRKTCPAMLSIKPIVEQLATRVSYDKVTMTVEREGSTLSSNLSIQQGARSLIGLVLPLSDCPVMMKLRPMARLHLPMGDRVNTSFRFLGMYLIAQFLKGQLGQRPDWGLGGLLELLEDIHMVNRGLTERIRTFQNKDATVNALVGLDFFANSVEWSIEDSLEELGPLFSTLIE
jgi:hypothetical protein